MFRLMSAYCSVMFSKKMLSLKFRSNVNCCGPLVRIRQWREGSGLRFCWLSLMLKCLVWREARPSCLPRMCLRIQMAVNIFLFSDSFSAFMTLLSTIVLWKVKAKRAIIVGFYFRYCFGCFLHLQGADHKAQSPVCGISRNQLWQVLRELPESVEFRELCN